MKYLIFCFVFIGFFSEAQEKPKFQFIDADFSGQIYAQKSDSLLIDFSSGYENQLFGKLITDSTLFELGRASELFTYHFIEHLAKIGQLKISDKVIKYIHDFPYPNISIKNLLDHKSGLNGLPAKLYHRYVYQNQNIKLVDKTGRFDNHDILQILIKHKPKLSASPGTELNYTELDYLLLNILTEKITFTPTQLFVERFFKHQEFVFAPVAISATDTILNKAFAYQKSKNGVKNYNNLKDIGMSFNDGTIGCKHYYSNAHDLVLWSRYISRDIDFEYVKTKEKGYFIKGYNYYPSFKALISRGEFCGFSTYLIFLPEKDIHICYLSNVTPSKSFESIVDGLIKELNN